MKALTVQQPWASAIFNGKSTENRSTLWSHRGILAIHAGARLSDRGMASPLVRAALADYSLSKADHGLPMGAVIGLVMVTDAHRNADGCCDSPWAEWSYREHKGGVRGDVVHYALTDAVEVDPVPVKGRLGLWTLPYDVAEAVRLQQPTWVWANAQEGDLP